MIEHGHGGLRRWYQHVRVEKDGYKDYEPAMCLAARGNHARKNAFVITLPAAYKYFMDDKKSEEYMKIAVQFIYELLDLGDVVSSQKYAEIASYIQDGLADLIKMPPKDLERKITGEFDLHIAGEKIASGDLKESIWQDG